MILICNNEAYRFRLPLRTIASFHIQITRESYYFSRHKCNNTPYDLL